MSRIIDTQPFGRPAELQRQPFDFQKGTRALQMTAAGLGGVVAAIAVWVIVSAPEPTPSRVAEQLTPLGTVTPETTTSSTPVRAPVAQPVRVTTARSAPIQQPRVTTSTEPPPQVLIVIPDEPPIETTISPPIRPRRVTSPPRELQSRTQEPQEAYEPQDSPLIDIGGLLP